MKVLVCGDRNWTDYDYIDQRLTALHHEKHIDLIIEGGARGADTYALEWADHNGIPVAHFPANWESYGRAVGPIRNKKMLVEGKPDLVLAFHENIHESKGTKDMVRRAIVLGVPVYLYPEGQSPE